MRIHVEINTFFPPTLTCQSITCIFSLLCVLVDLTNVRLSLPQTIGGVFIERLADYLLVKSVFGFSLAWDGGSGVYLKMSEEHHGAPCGLCGNFNHIAGDDLTTARGKTGSSGHSSSSVHPHESFAIIIHSALILTNYSSGGSWIHQSGEN